MRKSTLAVSSLLAVLCLISLYGADRPRNSHWTDFRSNGAAIANAMLELKGSETGVAYPTASSSTGNYTFTQIPVGLYELTATAADSRCTSAKTSACRARRR